MPSLAARLLRPSLLLARTGIGSVTDYSRVRAIFDKTQRAFPLPRGMHTEAITAAGVPCEWARREGVDPARTVLYLHGGGFVLGWYQQHRAMVGHMTMPMQAEVLVVDYRLAPEHPFPAALEDCLTAYRWLAERVPPDQIVVMGDSAGGNLTLTTLLALRDAGDPLPAAGVAISPVCDFEGTSPTFDTVYDELIPAEAARRMFAAYQGDADPHDPHLAPLHADFSGLPPLLLHASEREMLRGEIELTAARAEAAGADVTLTVWPDMWHVFHAYVPLLPEARTAIDAIGAWLADRGV
ncbi:MAG: alpha/beta hydrolase [Anaerolineae bacterium]